MRRVTNGDVDILRIKRNFKSVIIIGKKAYKIKPSESGVLSWMVNKSQLEIGMIIKSCIPFTLHSKRSAKKLLSGEADIEITHKRTCSQFTEIQVNYKN